MNFPARYTFSRTGEQGECKVKLAEDSLSVRPPSGEPILLSLRDILEFSESDFTFSIKLVTGGELSLSQLGYYGADFLRMLSKYRNEIILKDLLMDEKVRDRGKEAEFVRLDAGGAEKQKGKCELRLYETALVVLPENGELARLPYSDITGFNVIDHSLEIGVEAGEKYLFSKMGYQLDPFKEALSKAMNEIMLKVQEIVKEILPAADPVLTRKLAYLMREGRAAPRKEVESVSPDFWSALEKKVMSTPAKGEYENLKALARREKIAIGVKRGLSSQAGDYLWFLMPIYPSNAVAMEAIQLGEEEGKGKATYFFKMMSRREYEPGKKTEELDAVADQVIRQVNRCMIETNFRRLPIYLPEEKLLDPKYERYRFAIGKLPALRTLRGLFIGRVIHTSPEQAKQDIQDLLKFNVGTRDDGARWAKDIFDEEGEVAVKSDKEEI
jgi:hypothetical protein